MVNGTVLLTGASGLLGTWLRRTMPPERSIVSLAHRTRVVGTPTVRADLRDAVAVTAAFTRVRPSLVVHAAYAHDQRSIVAATQHVANAAREVGADILFISTDAVFSGDSTPRHEDAMPDPVWDYGRWKAHAEEIVADAEPTAGIIRLPLAVSIDPDDHVVRRIRSSAAIGDRTTWFDDELRQPAAAAELADGVWRIASLNPADRSGAWHLPGPESLTRYEIAKRVTTALGLDESTILAAHTPPRLGRPRHITMQDSRARRQIGWSPSTVLPG